MKEITASLLEETYDAVLGTDNSILDYTVTDTDKKLTRFVLDKTYTNDEGRLVVPALWNDKVKHCLPNNYRLAKSILNSTYKKYKNDHSKLVQYDGVIKDQIENKIIEEVSDETNLENVSFLAHNAVFRPQADSTKCRVVLLSNLCEKGNGNLSHNQISHPGPQLNSKLLTVATLYRFNKYLMITDIKSAFLQLCIAPEDTDKLLLVWFRDVAGGNLETVIYRFLRVPFEMRFSPFLLMIALYVILILSAGILTDSELVIRNMLYNLAYMDNLAFSSSSEPEMVEAYEKSISIFDTYMFKLQQFATNSDVLQSKMCDDSRNPTDTNCKLFGMSIRTHYNRKLDT